MRGGRHILAPFSYSLSPLPACIRSAQAPLASATACLQLTPNTQNHCYCLLLQMVMIDLQSHCNCLLLQTVATDL